MPNPEASDAGQSFTQQNRAFAIKTPLGEDKLVITGFRGHEAISQMFHFQLNLLAEITTEVPFERIVGQNATLEMRLVEGQRRHFHGLIQRFTRAGSDENFTHYRAELVPDLWRLTKKISSRVFQRLTIPDILEKVLVGLNVNYELSGVYRKRDYCVQYRESDFDFVSRLMEEEGIYYFFTHAESKHTMVIADGSRRYHPISEPKSVIYDARVGEALLDEMRVMSFEKTQELRAGEYTLRDYCFELPGQKLEAKEKIGDGVILGKVVHQLRIGGNDQLEIYEYPGGYAQRFDGISESGAEDSANLRGIFEDRLRTSRIRMEREETACIEIQGTSDCVHFVSGHSFNLQRHYDADGGYLLTHVEHEGKIGGYLQADKPKVTYRNRFQCIPIDLPYRPPRLTQKPVIAGIQTALVVGPPGEELFCDKYGRVKVQFHWDREGKKDAGSSCWLRVAQPWAGDRWGAFFWPRIGHEVVVTFEEGDPDQPIIIGSVYNADNMPPFELPINNQLGGFKSASVRGLVNKNFNGILFNDQKGHEHLAFHSERHMSFNSEFDKSFHAGRHKHETVSNVSTLVIGSLPGGGGSGGGGGTMGYQPFGEVDSQGIPGLNSVVVYGENLQVAVGLNHQLAVGSNLQLCINPTALAADLDLVGIADTLFTSGPGGNTQLTLGTSANIVLGKTFNLNMGETYPINAAEHLGTKIACALLGLVTVLMVTFYGIKSIVSTNPARVTLVATFEVIIQVCLAVIMTIEGAYSHAKDDWVGGIGGLFQPKFATGHIAATPCSTINSVLNAALTAVEVGGEMAVAITLATLPPVLAAENEKLD
jgi:type VI secretion system secreted protein VgrG